MGKRGPKRVPIHPGDRHGRLVILREAQDRQRTGRPIRRVEARCDCGTVQGYDWVALRTGHVRSCGCLHREVSADTARALPALDQTIHGLSDHPLYGTWVSMIHRCENPGNGNYRWYGARGIMICAEWHDVAAFIAGIERLLGPRPPGMSLDRVDNNGPYAPWNVRWATPLQQRHNQRSGI